MTRKGKFILLCFFCQISIGAPNLGATAPDPLVIPFPSLRAIDDHNGRLACKDKLIEPVVSLNLRSVYDQTDDSRSRIDRESKARYDQAIAQTRDFLTLLTRKASNYSQSDGRRLDEARCALDILDQWAKADALSHLQTRQTYLSMTRIIAGAAMAYMQVAPAAQLFGMDTGAIEAWLRQRAEATMPIYLDGSDRRSNRQNHRYWGGFAVAAVGVAVNHPDFLSFGYESFKLGVCQVEPNGTLPLELDRKSRARDYHVHAVAPLVMLASILEANGQAAYALCDNALERLVTFTLEALIDPTEIEALTGVRQIDLPREASGHIRRDRIAWLEVYLMRYPQYRPVYGALYDTALFSSNLGGRVSAIYNPDFRN